MFSSAKPYIGLFLLFFLGTAPIAQESLAEQLEQDISDYESFLETRQQELQTLEETLSQTSSELQERIQERDIVESELFTLQEEQAILLSAIEELNVQIEANQQRIGLLEERLNQLKLRIRGLLLNLYKQRAGQFAGEFSQAETFHEFQVKNYYLSRLSEQDASLINELNTTIDELVSVQEKQRLQLAELSKQEDVLAQNKEALTQKRTELDAIITELNASQEGQLAQQQSLIEDQADLETQLNDLTRQLAVELERLQAREQAQAAIERREGREGEEGEEANENSSVVLDLSNLPPLASGYLYPIESPRLLSSFGEAGIPGVQLQAQQDGAAVRSVQPGIVIEVQLASANQGYVVAVKHDEGLTTAYVNLQALPLVKRGDAVTQGQIIGYLGGGALIAPDVLQFHTMLTDPNGNFVWKDPGQLLGF